MTPVVPRDVLNLEQTFTEFDKLTRQDIAGNHEVIPQIIDYAWYVTIVYRFGRIYVARSPYYPEFSGTIRMKSNSIKSLSANS